MSRIVMILLLSCAAVLAQSNRGGITGTVFDSSGAAVPGATVTVTNTGTNSELKLKTSQSGAYTAQSLDPVLYRVAVEAGGFKTSVMDNVKVDTATVTTVNVTLVPGQVNTRRVSSTLRHLAWEFSDFLPLSFGRLAPAC